MKKDKIRIFILEISLIVFLFFALFALNIVSRKILALIIFIYAIVVFILVEGLISSKNLQSLNLAGAEK